MFDRIKGLLRPAGGGTQAAPAPAPPAVASRERSVALKAEGDRFLAAGNLAEAARCFRSAIEADPGDAAPYLPLGYALRAEDQLDAAIAALETALKLDPRAIDGHYLLALCLQDQGRLPEAIRHLEAIVALDPERRRRLCAALPGACPVGRHGRRCGDRREGHRPAAGVGRPALPVGQPEPASRPARRGDRGLRPGARDRSGASRGELQLRHRPARLGSSGRGAGALRRGVAGPTRLSRRSQSPRQRAPQARPPGRRPRQLRAGAAARARADRGMDRQGPDPARRRSASTRRSLPSSGRARPRPTTSTCSTTSAWCCAT